MDGNLLLGDAPHIAPRREFNSFAPIRHNALYCYGVDFLSNKELLSIFADFDPKHVEWLDDSSCNVVFDNEHGVGKVLKNLATHSLDDGPDSPWFVSKGIEIKNTCKRRGSTSRAVNLQLRIANAADVKDPTHSGHTDSVYYAHVKELQALQKQSLELRRAKKRQRYEQFVSGKSEIKATDLLPESQSGIDPNASRRLAPANNETDSITASTDTGSADAASCSASDVSLVSKELPPPSHPSNRVGYRSLLDPLLYLRAPASKNHDATGEIKEDLKVALQRAEEEYAAIPQSVCTPRGCDNRTNSHCADAKDHSAAKKAGTKHRKDSAPLQGKKRRPAEQELRAVCQGAPRVPQKKTLREVEQFIEKHKVQCQRHALKCTFRNIIYKQQTKNKPSLTNEAQKADQSSSAKKSAELPPWDQYLQVNLHFSSRGHLMHAVSWNVDARRVLAVVPHLKFVDIERLARALQKPVASVRKRSLTEVAQETKFPVFVCPPFGHPVDEHGRYPIVLVDSSVHDLKKPLLFDCGSVGLSIFASEFIRVTGAACVEGLAGLDAPAPAPRVQKLVSGQQPSESGSFEVLTKEPHAEAGDSSLILEVTIPQPTSESVTPTSMDT